MLLRALHDYDNLRYWYSEENRKAREQWEMENFARSVDHGLPRIGKNATFATSVVESVDESSG